MSNIVHTSMDRMPGNRVRPATGGLHGLAQGVQRAGADVAEDDADRAKRQGPDVPVACGLPFFGAVGGGGLCHGGSFFSTSWGATLRSLNWARLIHRPPSR